MRHPKWRGKGSWATSTKQQWMAEFERLAVEAGHFQPGRVCWDTAHFFFNTGASAADAVNTMTNNREG